MSLSRPASMQPGRLPRWAWLVLGLLALTLRLGFFSQYSQLVTFERPVFVPDARYFLDWARHIAEDEEFRPGDAYFMGPLYPHVLARAPEPRADSIRVLQVGLGVLTCLLLAAGAAGLFGWAAGLVAGGLAALYGPFWFFELQILPDMLVLALETGWLLILLRARPNADTPLWALAGALVGLSCLGRGNTLLVIPLVAVLLLIRGRGGAGRALAAFLIAALLPIAAATVRNRVVGGEWVLISANGGINFYIGNSKLATGTWAPVPDIEDPEGMGGKDPYLLEQLSRRGTLELRPGEASQLWLEKGLQSWRYRPWRTLALMGRKLLLLFDRHELDVNEDFTTVRRFAPILWMSVGFALVAVLGLAGLGLGLARGAGLGLLVPLLAYTLSGVFFFVTSRHRLPLAPPLIILTAGAATELVWAAMCSRWKRLLAGGLLLALAAALVYTPVLPPRAYDEIRIGGLRRLANAERAVNDFAAADLLLAEALALAPGRPELLLDRAANAFVLKRYAEGARHAREALERKDSYRTRYLLGVCALYSGDAVTAAENLQVAVMHDRTRPEGWEDLGRALAQLDALPEAEEAFEQALALAPGREGAAILLAAAKAKLGKTDEAATRLEKLIERSPHSLTARMALAELRTQAGEVDAAMKLYREVIGLHDTAVQARTELGKLQCLLGQTENCIETLREALKLSPRQSGLRLHLATALRTAGQIEAAVQAVEEELRFFGPNQSAAILLENLKESLVPPAEK